MLRMGRWVLCGALVAGLLGCRSSQPRLQAPGTVEQQQINATMFDPYSDQEAGPQIEGGRPLDYQQPLTESDRSRLIRSRWLPF